MTTSFTTHFRFGLPDFLAGPWHADWYTLVRLMDEVLYEIAVSTIMDTWTNSTVYAVGNIRIDPNLGSIWTCLVAHTSASSPTTFATDRSNHPTFWGVFPGAVTLVDANYTDITVSLGGTVFTINNNVVTYTKMQDVSATARVLGRKSAGAGDVEELTNTDLLTVIGLQNNILASQLSTQALQQVRRKASSDQIALTSQVFS